MSPAVTTTTPETAATTARALAAERRHDEAWALIRALLVADDDPSAWSTARNLLRAGAQDGWAPPARREVRLAVLCTYEGAMLTQHLEIACRAFDIEPVVYAGPYGQLEQEVLATGSELSRFEPTHVLLAPTTYDLAFPEFADDLDSALTAAVRRWSLIWEAISRNLGARVLQHAFVVPDETPFGHLAMRLPASRPSLVRELNTRLAAAAASDVLLVDCERLASRIGKERWCDPRLWHAARQPYAYDALPLLARETAAVLAGDVGLAARCLVVDLDNTLWGGVVAEEGMDGIVIGEGPEGEAYAAFQDYLYALKERGVVLAVASKNDEEVAREPFERHRGMRLRLDDFAVFIADWRRKSEQIATIAERLGLGLDALVFVDDNPAECAEVAASLPAVQTVPLVVPPSEFVRTLAVCPRFEAPSLTPEDMRRQSSYIARAGAEELRSKALSLEDFWRSLEMSARVRELDPSTVERTAQLTRKTNQFNLTLVRRSRDDIERLMGDPAAICRTLELEDRFANHGLVGLGFVVVDPSEPRTALIDTLLLSCRVIGRTAELHLLSHLARAAAAAGYSRLRGVYVEGPRNGLVADLYPQLGFVARPDRGSASWEHDLTAGAPLESVYISDRE
jgi:FkbH-like protein